MQSKDWVRSIKDKTSLKNKMNFSENYDSLTEQINSIMSTQITDVTWNSVAGGLDKVSTSSMGFAWGIGGGDVYVCQLPCNGEWKKVDSGAIDIITDDNHVYVLTPTSLKFKSASNVDQWVEVKTPNLTSIVCTSSYIWGQAGDTKYRLAKPGTTGNWIKVQTGSGVRIDSASGNALYGIDATGNAVKTDEAMQSGWSVVPEFIGAKLSKIIGDIDQSALYGIDTTNQLKRCVSGKCNPVDTAGYTPKSVTAEPSSKTLWMTTQNSGTKGNIFTHLDSHKSILPNVEPIDKQRDQVVGDTKNAFIDSTHSNVMSKQIQTVIQFLSKFFNVKRDPNVDVNNKKLSHKVEEVHTALEELQSLLPVIQRIVPYVLAAAAVYFFSSILGFITNIIVVGILGYGIYDIYFLQPKL
jgi:hypothetical protein